MVTAAKMKDMRAPAMEWTVELPFAGVHISVTPHVVAVVEMSGKTASAVAQHPYCIEQLIQSHI